MVLFLLNGRSCGLGGDPVLLDTMTARWDRTPELTSHPNTGFGIWDFDSIQWGCRHSQQKPESPAQRAQCIGAHTAYITIHDLLEHVSSWKSTLWIRLFSNTPNQTPKYGKNPKPNQNNKRNVFHSLSSKTCKYRPGHTYGSYFL